MSGADASYLFGSHFTKEHLNRNWSQQVNAYSGTHAMFLWNKFIIEISSHLFSCGCNSWLLYVSCDTLARAWSAFRLFLTGCLFICLMCCGLPAFRFLKVRRSISLTCSWFNFRLLTVWCFLFQDFLPCFCLHSFFISFLAHSCARMRKQWMSIVRVQYRRTLQTVHQNMWTEIFLTVDGSESVLTTPPCFG